MTYWRVYINVESEYGSTSRMQLKSNDSQQKKYDIIINATASHTKSEGKGKEEE